MLTMLAGLRPAVVVLVLNMLLVGAAAPLAQAQTHNSPVLTPNAVLDDETTSVIVNGDTTSATGIQLVGQHTGFSLTLPFDPAAYSNKQTISVPPGLPADDYTASLVGSPNDKANKARFIGRLVVLTMAHPAKGQEFTVEKGVLKVELRGFQQPDTLAVAVNGVAVATCDVVGPRSSCDAPVTLLPGLATYTVDLDGRLGRATLQFTLEVAPSCIPDPANTDCGTGSRGRR
jgi:hypothetical protein